MDLDNSTTAFIRLLPRRKESFLQRRRYNTNGEMVKGTYSAIFGRILDYTSSYLRGDSHVAIRARRTREFGVSFNLMICSGRRRARSVAARTSEIAR